MRQIIKPVQDIDYALRVYYGNGYINNKDIKTIFDVKSDASVSKLKKMVRAEEIKRGQPVVIPKHISVKIAFEVWGIDIKELESNRRKLIALNLSDASA